MSFRHPQDSSYQPPEWTSARVRQKAEVRAGGRVHRFVAAVQEPTGTLAGFTELGYGAEYPSVCYQEDTAVLREFRGRGLGRAIKAEMMRWLVAEQTGLEIVMTNTAAEVRRALSLSRPTCTSMKRWRTPAQKWCR